MQKYNFAKNVRWCDKEWIQWKWAGELCDGNFSRMPLEVVFDKYLLRDNHSILFVNCVDESRGEPFEIWEIQPTKIIYEDDMEIILDDNWDGQCTHAEILAVDMTTFLRNCLQDKKMVLYIPQRETWDERQLADVILRAEKEERITTTAAPNVSK